MITRRNIAMICLFCDLDRGDLLRYLRVLPQPERRRVVAGLLLEATRW